MKFKHILLTLVLALTTVAASAQALKPATAAQQRDMTARINKVASTTQSITCNFTQVKTMSFLNEKLTSTGRMFYDNKGRLRWEYTKPYSYTFVIAGGKVLTRSGKTTQSIDLRSSRLFQNIAQMMLNSMTGRALTDTKQFKTALYTGSGEWVAVLTPVAREVRNMFKTIKLHFDPRTAMVTRVDMVEKSGDTTVITLHNVKTGTRIDENVFSIR